MDSKVFCDFLLRVLQKVGILLSMEKRITCYVSLKNPLTWIAFLLMMGSAGLRVAYWICEKGADSSTMWLLTILPAAACLIYGGMLLLCGREHFYRTTIPVAMMAVYFAFHFVNKEIGVGYLMVYLLLLAAYVIFYKQLVSSFGQKQGLMFLLNLSVLVLLVYDYQDEILSNQWGLWFRVLPNLTMAMGLMTSMVASAPHLDGRNHPTWGDRADGRRVRTVSGMLAVTPYIMVKRNGANNQIRTELEISNLEKYVREKRKEGLTSFGLTHVLIAAYCRCLAKYPACNRFIAGQRIFSRDDDIVFNMVVKKDMTLESPDTCIKLHLKPSDTVYDIYRKFDEAVQNVKDTPLDSSFDQTVNWLLMLPSLLLSAVFGLLRLMDYFGLIPKFLLEISPFHGSVFFTSMGSLGIPPVVHHLYDFGNVPMFVAFGAKYRRNEIALDGSIEKKKYMDVTFNMDERICDGFYYAAVLKYFRRILADPIRLDVPPETVEQDIP